MKRNHIGFVGLFFLIFHSQSTLAGAVDGKTIFLKHCKACHAADARGNPKMTQSMNLELAKFDLLDDSSFKKKDSEWNKIIKNGSGKMKGYKSKLKRDEIDAVIKYVRSLKK